MKTNMKWGSIFWPIVWDRWIQLPQTDAARSLWFFRQFKAQVGWAKMVDTKNRHQKKGKELHVLKFPTLVNFNGGKSHVFHVHATALQSSTCTWKPCFNHGRVGLQSASEETFALPMHGQRDRDFMRVRMLTSHISFLWISTRTTNGDQMRPTYVKQSIDFQTCRNFEIKKQQLCRLS